MYVSAGVLRTARVYMNLRTRETVSIALGFGEVCYPRLQLASTFIQVKWGIREVGCT